MLKNEIFHKVRKKNHVGPHMNFSYQPENLHYLEQSYKNMNSVYYHKKAIVALPKF